MDTHENRPPIHPGEYVRLHLVEPKGLRHHEVAKAMNMERSGISQVIRGEIRMSVEMARRFEIAWGLDMEWLLRMQCACDAYEARSRVGLGNCYRRRVPVTA